MHIHTNKQYFCILIYFFITERKMKIWLHNLQQEQQIEQKKRKKKDLKNTIKNEIICKILFVKVL